MRASVMRSRSSAARSSSARPVAGTSITVPRPRSMHERGHRPRANASSTNA
jgi:hypothetical protein